MEFEGHRAQDCDSRNTQGYVRCYRTYFSDWKWIQCFFVFLVVGVSGENSFLVDQLKPILSRDRLQPQLEFFQWNFRFAVLTTQDPEIDKGHMMRMMSK